MTAPPWLTLVEQDGGTLIAFPVKPHVEPDADTMPSECNPDDEPEAQCP